jgi:hypothetical protein
LRNLFCTPEFSQRSGDLWTRTSRSEDSNLLQQNRQFYIFEFGDSGDSGGSRDSDDSDDSGGSRDSGPFLREIIIKVQCQFDTFFASLL